MNLRAEAEHHAGVLQALRNSFFLHEMGLSRRAHSMATLVSTVVMSGLLPNASDVKMALQVSVDIIVPASSLREYFRGFAKIDHAIMSAARIRSHRLTFHMAYCALIRARHKSMLLERGVVSWRSTDLSPQAGYEGLMHGGTTMRQEDLARALGLAHTQQTTTDDHQGLECASSPQSLLALDQGVPVGVGSGRSSLPYKMHAYCHAVKLMAHSWTAAAVLMNSTVTWVGDLGESSITGFHHNLKVMFGSWIDPPPDGSVDAGGAAAEHPDAAGGGS